MIWGMTLHPGEEFTRKVLSDEHLTLASLECRAEKCIDGGRPSSCLLLKTGRGQHVLCTLEEGVTNQQCLDLILEQGEKITFLVEGTGIVYLTGYTSTKRQRELSWPIRDSEGGNTGFDDSFQGETDILSQKDVSDEGDDVMQEVSGNHGDDEGNHSDSDGNHSDDIDESGDDDGEDGSYQSDGHDDERIVKDDSSGREKVVEGVSDTIVDGPEPGNSNHQENGRDGHQSDAQEEETNLPQKVRKEARSKKVSASARSKRSNTVRRATSPRITSSLQEEDDGSLTNAGVYRCFICLESFVKKDDCAAHEAVCNKGNQWKRRDQEPHRCRFCGKAFDRPSQKINHESIHTNKKAYGCRYCEKKFTTIYTARKHERSHSMVESYMCQLCPKSFRAQCYLEEHMRSHTGERPFQCHMCPSFFSTRSARNRHVRRHKTRYPHQCQECGKGFSTEKKLQGHFKLHTDEPTYQCHYCDMAFVRHYHRTRHEKATHLS